SKGSTARMSTTTLPATPPTSGVRSSQGAALAVILGSALMIALDASVMTVAMPKIKDELGFSPTNLSWIQNACTLAFGSLLLLGGSLTSWVSWPWVFYINLPVGAAVLLLAPRYITEPSRNPGRLDVFGALLSTVGMTLLVYGFIRAAAEGWGESITLGSFAL